MNKEQKEHSDTMRKLGAYILGIGTLIINSLLYVYTMELGVIERFLEFPVISGISLVLYGMAFYLYLYEEENPYDQYDDDKFTW